MYMADVIAATAERQIALKRTPIREKQRQCRIAGIVAIAIRGEYCPSARNLEAILARLDGLLAG